MTPEHTADEVPVESDGADTLSLVERLQDDGACASTHSEELERQIMDSRVPKNEREWWAKREIERLRSQGGAPTLSELVGDYLAELDSPAPDYAMRKNYRDRMRIMLAAAPQPPSVSSEIETRTRPSPITAYCEPDDDRMFALLCARKGARTDDDAAAIAWAEDEIADLRKDRASVVELANKHVAEIERLRAELEKARDGMQNALADAIKDAISDLDDHAGDDLPTRRFLAGAIDGLKKALFIAVSASPVPQNGEGE